MMSDNDPLGVSQFLLDYPRMAIRPGGGAYLRLKGTFDFIADHGQFGEIRDSYSLQIDVPQAFPRDLPKVIETAGRIPRTPDYHVNGDGTLCLGSHLRLLVNISKNPTLSGFAGSCIVPYFYAMSHKLQRGGELVFGELAHYSHGMLADYAQLFRLATKEQARHALQLLTMEKRIANKCRCPCGCGRRLGKCNFNRQIRAFRRLASRKWFESQLLYSR